MHKLLKEKASAGVVLYKPTQHTSAMVSPTKIFDYFSAGLPVIGPEMVSVTEYVRDGIEGKIYEAGNAQSLVQAIEAVFLDERLYMEMKANTAIAAYCHSWDKRAEQLANFIKEPLQLQQDFANSLLNGAINNS
jgi:glycosyltransferase involved in cell wall biosynthesis